MSKSKVDIDYVPTDNAVQLCKRLGLVADKLKIGEREALTLLDKTIRVQSKRLEEAKKIYRQQQAEIGKLSSPQLWRFETPQAVPPDFRHEYLQRLNAGNVRVVEEPGKPAKPLKMVLEMAGRVSDKGGRVK